MNPAEVTGTTGAANIHPFTLPRAELLTLIDSLISDLYRLPTYSPTIEGNPPADPTDHPAPLLSNFLSSHCDWIWDSIHLPSHRASLQDLEKALCRRICDNTTRLVCHYIPPPVPHLDAFPHASHLEVTLASPHPC